MRDAQDALDEQLSREQRGILAFSRVENMSARVATYYVEDPAHAVQLAGQLGRQHVPDLEGENQRELRPFLERVPVAVRSHPPQ